MYVSVCMFVWVYVCMIFMYIGLYMFMNIHAYGGQRSTPGIIPQDPSALFVETWSPTLLELTTNIGRLI